MPTYRNQKLKTNSQQKLNGFLYSAAIFKPM